MFFRVNQSSIMAWLIFMAFTLPGTQGWSETSNDASQMDLAASSLLLDIAAAGDTLVAVGERGHILYSTDIGNTWIQAKVPTTAMLTRVFFSSSMQGWAVGHDGHVLVTNDGGKHWQLQRDGVSAQRQLNTEKVDKSKNRVDRLRLDLQRTTDSENEPDDLSTLDEAQYQLDEAMLIANEPVFPPPLMDVWFTNKQQGWVSGAYGTLLYTANGGRQWQDWSHTLDDPDQLHLNGVVAWDDGTVLLASEWGTIFRSSNAGQSWTSISSGYEGSFFGLLRSHSTDNVFAYGLRGTVYRSSDRGLSWSQLESAVVESLFGGYASQDGRLLFVGAGGAVTQSMDEGNSFRPALQRLRDGAYGIAPLPDGRFMLTGEGGSRLLLDARGASQ